MISWVYVLRPLQYFRMSFYLLIINHKILERVIQKFFGIPIFWIWKTYPVFIPINGCLKWQFVIQNVINLILWCFLNNKNPVLNIILGDLTNYIWSFKDVYIFVKLRSRPCPGQLQMSPRSYESPSLSQTQEVWTWSWLYNCNIPPPMKLFWVKSHEISPWNE